MFTLNIDRDIWKYGLLLLLLLEYMDLIKENKEGEDNIGDLLLWFPNFWVRNVTLL